MLIRENGLALLLVGSLAVCAATTANASGIAYVGPRGGAVVVGRPAPAYVAPAPLDVVPRKVYVTPAPVVVTSAPIAITARFYRQSVIR